MIINFISQDEMYGTLLTQALKIGKSYANDIIANIDSPFEINDFPIGIQQNIIESTCSSFPENSYINHAYKIFSLHREVIKEFFILSCLEQQQHIYLTRFFKCLSKLSETDNIENVILESINNIDSMT